MTWNRVGLYVYIFNGGKELCLATVSTAKSMLMVRQEFVLVIVRHDLGINDMLKNFAGYTCEGYRSIVGGVIQKNKVESVQKTGCLKVVG